MTLNQTGLLQGAMISGRRNSNWKFPASVRTLRRISSRAFSGSRSKAWATLLFSNFDIKIHSAFSVPEEALSKSFQNSGAKYINSEIRFGAKLKDDYQNKEYLDSLLTDISNRLEIGEISCEIFENDLEF
jgi:hypothetical protein